MLSYSELLAPEIQFKTSRSGGKGGQNVNKVSTKVEINFHIDASMILTTEQKSTLHQKLSNHINKEGVLQIISQSERTQLGNKRVALKKMDELFKQAFFVQKKRKPTKPTKAAKEKRILQKKRLSEIKNLRKRID